MPCSASTTASPGQKRACVSSVCSSNASTRRRATLAVSYFIVCALWRIDQLGQALEKARRDLPTGEQRVFGLSNVLFMLNGLLKYRHPDFNNLMLDDIERLTHGLDEHCFRIREKINAIRTSRLPKL